MSFSGLIGKNIEYSYSKQIHNLLGNKDYEIFSIDSTKEFKNFIKQDVDYLNITIPYKEEAYKAAQVKDDVAIQTKVCNLLIKRDGVIYGYNTDCYGFECLLESKNINVELSKVLILGTGATARSIAFVCKQMGCSSVKFLSRNPDKISSFGYDKIEEVKDAEIIINATPIKDGSLIDFSKFTNVKHFIDVGYNPNNSQMILDASKRGINTTNGLFMLVAQAVRSYELSQENMIDADIEEIYYEIQKSYVKVLLIGMPFSGKTTISKAFSEKYGYKHLDIDEEISKQFGMPIEKIFEVYGENKFREAENDLMLSLKDKVGYIVSMGGGAVLHEETLKSLQNNSIIVSVFRPLNLIDENELKGRPLCNSFDDLKNLLNLRGEKYAEFSQFEIGNTGSIDNAVDALRELL